MRPIKVKDPLDKKGRYIVYSSYDIDGKMITVRTEFSNCLLFLKVVEDRLFEFFTGECLGKIL